MLVTLSASRWLREPLVILAALVVQTTLLSDMRPFGALGDVMLLLSVCAGLAAGQQVGALCGFGTGVAYDLLLRTPFGLSALVYAAVGFACGFLQANAAVAPWWITTGVVAGASAVGITFYAFVGAVFGLQGAVNLHLVVVILVVSVLNGLLAVPVLGVERWALRVERA